MLLCTAQARPQMFHIHWYNNVFLCSVSRVHDTVIDVEYPLIEGCLKAIDKQLGRAITELNWTSEGE